MKKDASSGAVEVEIEDGMMKSPATGLGAKFPVSGSPYVAPRKKGADVPGLEEAAHPMPPASVMTRLILIMVWRKLIRNPNTYSSLIGLVWSLVSFRYNHNPITLWQTASVHQFTRQLMHACIRTQN